MNLTRKAPLIRLFARRENQQKQLGHCQNWKHLVRFGHSEFGPSQCPNIFTASAPKISQLSISRADDFSLGEFCDSVKVEVSVGSVEQGAIKMMFAYSIVAITSLLIFFYKFGGEKFCPNKVKTKLRNFWFIVAYVYKFCFNVKSEDRLYSLRFIHKVFPRYVRIKIFSFDNIVVYDPELCKKIFNSQSACQRPFRNCIQLEYGLLSSKCEFH